MDNKVLVQLALLERLSDGHEMKAVIQKEIKNNLAGFGGENRVLEYLKREMMLEKEPVFMSNVFLPIKDGHAQIDIIVLHEEFICVLEVKNMTGEFYFDPVNYQFHRILDGRREGMKNPEAQLHRAVKAAERFLGVPVHGVIVLASRSGRVVEGPKNYPIISSEYLPYHLENLADGSVRYNEKLLSEKIRQLPKKEYHSKLLNRYGLSMRSIRNGITCETCRSRSLKRLNRKWYCEECRVYSKDAHEVALQEYSLIFGKDLPIQDAYKWLGVTDKYLLYRLLEKSTLLTEVRGIRQIILQPKILEDYFRRFY